MKNPHKYSLMILKKIEEALSGHEVAISVREIRHEFPEGLIIDLQLRKQTNKELKF